jgi:hypothetical protein
MPDPITRGISVTVHERMYPFIKKAARESKDGNVNEYIRMLIYKDLKERGLIDLVTAAEILI